MTSGVNQPFTLTVSGTFTNAANATFVVGSSGSFAITTSGIINPALIEADIPSATGLTLVNHLDGTATLSGTPSPGSGGTYEVGLGAFNSAASGESAIGVGQNVTVTIDETPVFTSPDQTTFTPGQPGTLTIAVRSFPTAHLYESDLAGDASGLPAGVSFVDNDDGTATISGAPAAGTEGTYNLILGATDGLTSGTVQGFTLTVAPPSPPVFTSANQASIYAETNFSFTITTTGSPAAHLYVSNLEGTGSGLPRGVSFTLNANGTVSSPDNGSGTVAFTDNGNGTATLSGRAFPPASGQAQTFDMIVGAANGPASSAVQLFSLTVLPQPYIMFASHTSASFTIGSPGSFTITTQGSPTVTSLFESNGDGSASGLPDGLVFHDNGDGTATISGTPVATSKYYFPLVLGASNGVVSAVAPLSINLITPSVFTSANQATFNVGSPGTFTVSATGFPIPAFFASDLAGDSSGLPSGVLFHNNQTGTAAISGTPAEGSAGTYYVILGAYNGSYVVQGFTLTVV